MENQDPLVTEYIKKTQDFFNQASKAGIIIEPCLIGNKHQVAVQIQVRLKTAEEKLAEIESKKEDKKKAK